MIILKVLNCVCVMLVIIQTIMAISMYISDVIKSQKTQTECIHVQTDCEECISQTACPYKENNIVRVRKES